MRIIHDPDLIASLFSSRDSRGCLKEGCERKHDARGYCSRHYYEAKATGLFGDARRCAVDDCSEPVHGTRYCQKHYLRMRVHGTTDQPSLYRTDEPMYVTLHQRISSERGRADGQVCAGCGLPAKEWALSKDATGPIRDEDGRRYSLDVHDYQAMCGPCHHAYDEISAKAWLTRRAGLGMP